MKNLFCVFALLFLSISAFGQIPNLQIRDTVNTAFNLPDYMQNDRNYGLIIWSAQDPPSVAALEDYHQHYSGWNSNYNIEFLVLSVDDSVQRKNVTSFMKTKGWNYTLIFANSADVLQAFGIQSIPYIYLVDQQQKIKYEVAGAAQGTALGQQISTHFTLGIELEKLRDFVTIATTEDKLVFKFAQSQKFIKISVFDLSGRLIHQQSSEFSNSVITMETNALKRGTIAIIRVEDEEKIRMIKKIII